MTTLDRPRLLTTPEAAEYLGLAVSTLTNWRSTKRTHIPFVRLGGKAIRYRKEDLDRWLQLQRVASGDESA